MKRLYKQLQKDQMKKLKGENRTEGGGVVNTQKKFVSNCLVKVLISEAATVTKDQLRVCLCLLYSVCLQNHTWNTVPIGSKTIQP